MFSVGSFYYSILKIILLYKIDERGSQDFPIIQYVLPEHLLPLTSISEAILTTEEVRGRRKTLLVCNSKSCFHVTKSQIQAVGIVFCRSAM